MAGRLQWPADTPGLCQQTCDCKMGYSGLNQEQVVAMPPCNLVRMLQVGAQRGVSSFRSVVVQEEELCQPLV
eukprot:2084349-Pleurochrysis_carterae.AAC.1